MQNRKVYLSIAAAFIVLLVLVFYMEARINATVDARVTQTLEGQSGTIEAQQTLIADLRLTSSATRGIRSLPTFTPSPSATITSRSIASLTPTPSHPYWLYEVSYRSPVSHVDWHPSGNLLAFGHSNSSAIIIIDAVERREIRRQEGLTDFIRNVRWSPDGRFLAAGDFNGRILVWDTSTWETVTSLAVSGFVQTLGWSSDGRFIVASAHLQVRIWETETWSMVEDSDMEFVDTSVFLAPDASKVVYVANDRLMVASIVRRGELSPPHSIAQIPDANHYFMLSSWSNDGAWIVGGTNRGEIHVFDAETEEREIILTAHFGNIVDLRWSSNGRYLASAGVDETVHIWDATSWNLLTSLDMGRVEVGSIAWSPDSCFIAAQTIAIEIWTLPELCEQE